jgi:hypothetical protein
LHDLALRLDVPYSHRMCCITTMKGILDYISDKHTNIDMRGRGYELSRYMIKTETVVWPTRPLGGEFGNTSSMSRLVGT